MRETLKDLTGRPLGLDTDYIIAVKNFMYAGKDGYTMFADETV